MIKEFAKVIFIISLFTILANKACGQSLNDSTRLVWGDTVWHIPITIKYDTSKVFLLYRTQKGQVGIVKALRIIETQNHFFGYKIHYLQLDKRKFPKSTKLWLLNNQIQ